LPENHGKNHPDLLQILTLGDWNHDKLALTVEQVTCYPSPGSTEPD
jgi:hypothetical protein